MRIVFWGVRGSYPVPGPSTCRFGGNTSCVEVMPDDGGVIIIDAGTGIRRLGQRLASGPLGQGGGACHLLISHTHWDHIQGLPFFAPLYVRGNRITLYSRQRDIHLRTLFSSLTRDPYFPISLDEVAAEVRYREIIEGAVFEIGSVRVRCARLNHPFIALGYRLETSEHSVVYVSDTAPFDRMLLGYGFIGSRPDPASGPTADEADKLDALRAGVIDLCRGADLVIYDTMFEMSEYLACPHWGHSAPEHAQEIVEEAGARCLVLYHHAPQRTDDEQAGVVARIRRRAKIEVIGAAEGMVVTPSDGVIEGGV